MSWCANKELRRADDFCLIMYVDTNQKTKIDLNERKIVALV